MLHHLAAMRDSPESRFENFGWFRGSEPFVLRGKLAARILTIAALAALNLVKLTGQMASTSRQFDVASIRVTDPAIHSAAITGGPGSADPGRIRYVRVPMIYLLQTAYGVAADQVSGPGWIKDLSGPNLYDISATMSPGTTKEQFQLMMQNLLENRFRVMVHHETRNFSGYVLSVAKGGAKLKESTPDPNYVTPPMGVKLNNDGTLQVPARRGATVLQGKGVEHVGYREVPMAKLVSDLGVLVVRATGGDVTGPLPRVLDRTGLTGIYDFTLDYECLACQNAANEPVVFPSIFTALEKQLGLKLDKAQDVPVDVIVIEQVEKFPTEN